MRCNITGATLNLSLVVLLKLDRKQKDRLAAISPRTDQGFLIRAAAIAAALANGKITLIVLKIP